MRYTGRDLWGGRCKQPANSFFKSQHTFLLLLFWLIRLYCQKNFLDQIIEFFTKEVMFYPSGILLQPFNWLKVFLILVFYHSSDDKYRLLISGLQIQKKTSRLLVNTYTFKSWFNESRFNEIPRFSEQMPAPLIFY